MTHTRDLLKTLACAGALLGSLPGRAAADCTPTPAPTASGATSYVSPSGTDPATCPPAGATFRTLTRAVACAQPGSTVYVRAGTYLGANTLTAQGTAAAPILVAPYPGEQVILDGNGAIGDYGAVVAVSNAAYLTVYGFEIRNTGVPANRLTGGYGVNLTGSHHITIQGNTIHDTARNGIESDGHDLTFDGNEVYRAVLLNENEQSPTFWDAAVATRVPGPSAATAWSNITYRNNHIHDSWGEGLTALHVDTGLLEGNDVHDCYSVNIYLDNARHVTVNRNHSYVTSDAHNRTNDGPSRRAMGLQMSVEPYTHNGAYQGYALQDDRIVNNVIADTTEGIRFWASPFTGSANTYGALVIANNDIRGTSGPAIAIDPAPNAPSPSVLENNIIYPGQSGVSLSLGQPGAWTVSRNLFPAGVPSLAGAATSGNAATDPLLAGPVAGGPADGYRLQPGSPALGAGAPDPTVTSDYWCGPRNPASPSIGVEDASFSVSLGGASPVSLAPGQTVSLPVSTSASSGPPQSLTLAVSGLPAGVSATVSPSTVQAGQPATLTLTAAPGAPTTAQPAGFSLQASGITGASSAPGAVSVAAPRRLPIFDASHLQLWRSLFRLPALPH